MKKYFILLSLLLFNSLWAADYKNLPLEMIKGDPQKIADLKEKVVLVVNIATRCGLTGQLDDLEKLYQKYKEQGLVVIGVPSNDFMGQTPEGNEEVAEFCRLNYGVSFPLVEKMIVKGSEKNLFYQGLIQNSDRPKDEISWNFEKFVLNKSGDVVARFSPREKPLGSDLEKKIQELIK